MYVSFEKVWFFLGTTIYKTYINVTVEHMYLKPTATCLGFKQAVMRL
jgi:hypothetical protein